MKNEKNRSMLSNVSKISIMYVKQTKNSKLREVEIKNGMLRMR